MTSREWHEADEDDSDRVRAWPAQDDQERAFAIEGDPIDLWNRLVDALAEIAELTTQRDAARALATGFDTAERR